MAQDRYIWCGKELELQIDLETRGVVFLADPESGQTLDSSKSPLENLEAVEYVALVAAIQVHGELCSYSDFVPHYRFGDKANRAANVKWALNRKLYGWIGKNRLLESVASEGYVWHGPVETGNSPEERQLALARLPRRTFADGLLSRWSATKFTWQSRRIIPAALAMILVTSTIVWATARFWPMQAQSMSRINGAPLAPGLMIQNEWRERVPTDPVRDAALRWRGVFSVDNFEKRPITGLRLDIEFRPLLYHGHFWRLAQVGSPLVTRGFSSPEELLRSIEDNRTHASNSAAPVTIRSGGRGNFLFEGIFILTRDSIPCPCAGSTEDQNVTNFIAGLVDRDGIQQPTFAPIKTVLTLGDGSAVQVNAPSEGSSAP